MAPLPAVNRGFGGSQAFQAVFYADQLVNADKPSRVVFYEGDNDIYTGKSPEAFLEECRKFTAKVHAALPKTRIYFLSIKPSPSRAGKLETYKRANALLQAYTATDPRLAYIDVASAMYDQSGQIRRDIFGPDLLHMNAAGYAIWTDIIKKRLTDDIGKPDAQQPNRKDNGETTTTNRDGAVSGAAGAGRHDAP